MRLSHKIKVFQKQKKMICGELNWNKPIFKPGPWFEGYHEAYVERNAAPNATYYNDRRSARRLYRQGFFFGKRAIADLDGDFSGGDGVADESDDGLIRGE